MKLTKHEKHILLIDDDRDQLRLFMDAFESMEFPCKCTYVNDYGHALKMLEFVQPDCLFVRLDLHSHDAMKFLNTVKANEQLDDMQVVMYSESLTSTIIKKAIMEGADFCINKPQGSGELHQLLAEIFVKNNPVYAMHKN